MSKVYVVQNVHKWDAGKKRLAPKFDFTPATRWGELVFICPPNADVTRLDTVVPVVERVLEGYSTQDWLVLVGNPVLISVCAIVAHRTAGSLNALQWSTREKRYTPIKTRLTIGVHTD